MKRFQDFFLRQARITGILLLVFAFGPFSHTAAQQQSETAESLGLGGASRFDTGYSPIVIDRTSIVPGVPFNVKPTMDNLVSNSKTSMGGILNRFDTSKFGQMFSSGSAAPAVAAAGITRKTPAVAAAATAGAAAPKLYPPRLETDGEAVLSAAPDKNEIIERIERDLRDVLRRYPLNPGSGEDVSFILEGSTLTLRGRIDSSYTADILVLTMEMQPGIDKVVNEIVSLEETSE